MEAATRFATAAIERLRGLPDAERAIAHVGERLLRDVEAIADRCMESYRSEVAAYAGMPDDVVREPTVAGLVEGVRALAELRKPTPAEVERNRGVGIERARQGLPIEAMMQTWLIGSREIVSAWDREAEAAAVDPQISLHVRDFAWAWANFMMARAAQAHRATELDLAREDEQRRARIIRQLLSGTDDRGKVLRDAAVYGVEADRPYAPLRARPVGSSVGDLERHLIATGSVDRRRPVLCQVDGDLVGITPGVPSAPRDAVVAVGEPVGLTDIVAENAEVERAFETAINFGRNGGLIRPDDLHLLPLVISAAQTGDRLVRRHLGPIEELGPYADTLLETLDCYLAHNGRIEATARELHLHSNSVRHRLDRIHQLSGLDPRVTEQMIVLWWALRRRQVMTQRGDTLMPY